MKLTPKQERFVQEYLVDLNATAAAARAGYKDPNIGRQLITKDNVSTAIQEGRTALQKRTEIKQEKVVLECARLAFFDIRKLFDENGKPLDITKLDNDTAAALVGLDVQDVADSDGDYIGFIKKYKMADKCKMLELLGRYFGLWDRHDKQQTAVEDDPITKSLKEAADALSKTN